MSNFKVTIASLKIATFIASAGPPGVVLYALGTVDTGSPCRTTRKSGVEFL